MGQITKMMRNGLSSIKQNDWLRFRYRNYPDSLFYKWSLEELKENSGNNNCLYLHSMYVWLKAKNCKSHVGHCSGIFAIAEIHPPHWESKDMNKARGL